MESYKGYTSMYFNVNGENIDLNLLHLPNTDGKLKTKEDAYEYFMNTKYDLYALIFHDITQMDIIVCEVNETPFLN